MEIKNILVPTDFSLTASYGLEMARKLSETHGANIHLLYIVETAGDTVFETDGTLKDQCTEYNVEGLLKEAEISRQRFREQLEGETDNLRCEVAIGPFKNTVLSFIDKHQIDLVVMPTAGATGFKDWFSNSRAGLITSIAPVPVLTLKCDRSDSAFRHLMVGGDYSTAAPTDLEMLLTIQKHFNSKLHLVHINTSSNWLTTRRAERLMLKYAADHRLQNFEAHVYCDESVEQGLKHFAEDRMVDMIAVKNKKSIYDRLLKTDLARNMVNHVFFPVLTIN